MEAGDTFKILKNQLIYNGKPIELGDYEIHREVSRGANGIVYEANDPILRRRVAIKFWTNLKASDKRDKVRQGILEARKAYEARRSHVVEIYHAGIAQGLAFVVMEYVNGISLRKYLQQQLVPLPPRVPVAYGLLDICRSLHKDRIYHGDLHANNILLKEDSECFSGDPYLRASNIKIIDFGTSRFTGRRFSRRRHFRLIIETINELFYPLSIHELYGYAFPGDGNWDDIAEWVYHYLYLLRESLAELGYHQVSEYLSFHDFDSHEIHEISLPMSIDTDLRFRFLKDMRQFLDRTPLLKSLIETPYTNPFRQRLFGA